MSPRDLVDAEPIRGDEIGKRCNVCGRDIACGIAKVTRCTNRRCSGCHAGYCTGGGSTGPGHGMGNPPRNLEQAARYLAVYDAQGHRRGGDVTRWTPEVERALREWLAEGAVVEMHPDGGPAARDKKGAEGALARLRAWMGA